MFPVRNVRKKTVSKHSINKWFIIWTSDGAAEEKKIKNNRKMIKFEIFGDTRKDIKQIIVVSSPLLFSNVLYLICVNDITLKLATTANNKYRNNFFLFMNKYTWIMNVVSELSQAHINLFCKMFISFILLRILFTNFA